MQEVYKTLLNDAESALESLMKITLDDDLASADYKNAETSFLFDLCIFAELGNAKNNLIAVRPVLKLTLFNLDFSVLYLFFIIRCMHCHPHCSNC